MPPESNPQKSNRRGCYLVAAIVAVALLLLGFVATRTADRQQSNEATSTGP